MGAGLFPPDQHLDLVQSKGRASLEEHCLGERWSGRPGIQFFLASSSTLPPAPAMGHWGGCDVK